MKQIVNLLMPEIQRLGMLILLGVSFIVFFESIFGPATGMALLSGGVGTLIFFSLAIYEIIGESIKKLRNLKIKTGKNTL